MHPLRSSPLRSSRRRILALVPAFALLGGTLGAATAHAQDAPPSFTLTLRDNKFEPEQVQVPAGQKFELRVINAGTRGAEFESKDMRREKVIPPGQTVVINAGPLRPGSYEFFDDFHPSTRGRVIAR